MTETTTLEASSPEKPAEFSLREIYTIQYKDRALIAEKHFGMKSSGSPKEDHQRAIKRSMVYCDRMRFRFIHCEPFLISLEENEAKFNEI